MLRRVCMNLLDNAMKYAGLRSDARIEVGEGATFYFVLPKNGSPCPVVSSDNETPVRLRLLRRGCTSALPSSAVHILARE